MEYKRVRETEHNPGFVYMVFEYMDHDLTGILGQSQFIFDNSHLKSLCEQMLAGLAYLHHKGVIHRDIKASNILVNNKGELKLADLNLARFYQKRRRSDYTNRVITLWYRPPELLLGTTIYGPEVDMWSAGYSFLCVYYSIAYTFTGASCSNFSARNLSSRAMMKSTSWRLFIVSWAPQLWSVGLV